VSMVGVYPCLAYKCWLLSLLQIWDLAEKLARDLTVGDEEKNRFITSSKDRRHAQLLPQEPGRSGTEKLQGQALF
jgi:hypothetical protein